MDSNSEGGRSRSGSEGNISPVKEEAYYHSIGGHKKWPQQRTMASEYRYGMPNIIHPLWQTHFRAAC